MGDTMAIIMSYEYFTPETTNQSHHTRDGLIIHLCYLLALRQHITGTCNPGWAEDPPRYARPLCHYGQVCLTILIIDTSPSDSDPDDCYSDLYSDLYGIYVWDLCSTIDP